MIVYADKPNARLNGVPVVTSRLLEKRGARIDIPLTWKERLLSRPWRPWVASRPDWLMEPDDKIVRMPDGTLIMHPEILKRLLRELES